LHVTEGERCHVKAGSDGMWIVRLIPKSLRRERLHVTLINDPGADPAPPMP
jgi:hypothetical protein